MFRAIVQWICAISVTGWAACAAAQIVNVQQLAGKPLKPGWSGQVAVTGDWLFGNAQLLTGGGTGTVFFRHNEWVSLATVTGAYGIKGSNGTYADDPYQEKVFEHLRLRRQFAAGLSLEAFAQHEFDRWRRLKLRAVAGAGVRFDADPASWLHLACGLAQMAQWEELLKPKAGDAAGLVLEHRLSSYLTAAAEMTDTASFVATVYTQPRWGDFADVRGLVDLALVVAINKATALRLNWAMGYDTQPPIGVRGYDGSGKVSFVAGF